MHQPGASGSLSDGDQRRWVFLEMTEKQFCQRIEQLRKDISALGQDSGDVDGELSHNAHGGHSPLQRVKSREVSDFAMIAADASRTYQPFDFGSDFDIVALDEVGSMSCCACCCIFRCLIAHGDCDTADAARGHSPATVGGHATRKGRGRGRCAVFARCLCFPARVYRILPGHELYLCTYFLCPTPPPPH